MFTIGFSYTRAEISARIGGGLMDCLPHADGNVVAVCMRRDMNPDAPHIMLVGKGPNRIQYSEHLCQHQRFQAIPIFIKQGTNEWEYQGTFKATAHSRDVVEIQKHAARAGRSNIYMVINFEEC